MAQYESFQSNAAEFPLMRKWLLRALVISLLIHAGLLIFFNFKKLENFGNNSPERLAPPVHVFRQVTIAESAEKESKPDVTETKPEVKPIAIANDVPIADEVKFTPQVPQEIPQMPQEKPKADTSGFDKLANNPGNSLAAMEKQLSGVAGSLMESSVRSPHQPTIQVPAGHRPGDGSGALSGGIPGRQSLDDALSKVGGPISNKAVAMRGGALFEWGKAELRSEAIEDLQKLGLLIKRNPNATFIISGHTDHTGSHDTNLILSQQRADSVRDWLVTNLGIDPMRITTIGKADDEAFPTLGPDKSIDEQAPNRRVEITIKTHRK